MLSFVLDIIYAAWYCIQLRTSLLVWEKDIPEQCMDVLSTLLHSQECASWFFRTYITIFSDIYHSFSGHISPFFQNIYHVFFQTYIMNFRTHISWFFRHVSFFFRTCIMFFSVMCHVFFGHIMCFSGRISRFADIYVYRGFRTYMYIAVFGHVPWFFSTVYHGFRTYRKFRT